MSNAKRLSHACPAVIEYQHHRGHCDCCGITTLAELPCGVPRGQCGPRLAAFTGLLMGHFRQSKRRASSFLSDLLNIPRSPAWTVKIQNLVSDALSEPYCQLQSELAKQSQLYVDESPTTQHKAKAWLWVAVAPMFAVFGIFANRSRESLVAIIGDYSNTGNGTNAQRSIGKHSGDWRAPFARITYGRSWMQKESSRRIFDWRDEG